TEAEKPRARSKRASRTEQSSHFFRHTAMRRQERSFWSGLSALSSTAFPLPGAPAPIGAACMDGEFAGELTDLSRPTRFSMPEKPGRAIPPEARSHPSELGARPKTGRKSECEMLPFD